MEAKEDAYLQPAAVQWATGRNDGARHRGGQPPLATSGTRLEADSVLLEEVVWRHQVGYWCPEPVKREVRWHRELED